LLDRASYYRIGELSRAVPADSGSRRAGPAGAAAGRSIAAGRYSHRTETRQRRTPSTGRSTTNTGRSRRTQAARRNETAPAAKPSFGPTQEARTGTVGVYSDSTSTATKTNTRLVNIPQSITVLTKDYIRDQSFQSLTEATRYVPGVAIHQGEGNRDELVIRGVDSSANFYVNGFRERRPVFPRPL